MDRHILAGTLGLLEPDDLLPSWLMVELIEQHRQMVPAEARAWKQGIYRLMLQWRLEP